MPGWLTFEALALSIVLIAMAGALRGLCGTWLHPGALFAIWWCFSAILPLIFSPYDPVTPGAIAWVIVAAIVVGASATAGNGGFKTRLAVDRPQAGRLELGVLSSVLGAAIVLGVLSSVFFAKGAGVAFSDMLDIERLVVVSNQLYVARYAEGDAAAAVPPRMSQALLPFVYLAPAIGGSVMMLHRRVVWRLLSLAALAPAIIVTILQTTKAAVLFAATLWLSSYLAARLRLGKLGVLTTRHISIGVLLAVTVTAFFSRWVWRDWLRRTLPCLMSFESS